jgi:hypothetical protein
MSLRRHMRILESAHMTSSLSVCNETCVALRVCDLTPGLTTNELQTMVKRIEKRAMERRNRGAVHFNSEMNNTLFLSRRIDEG